MIKKALLVEIISQLLILLFLYAAVSKLITYHEFVTQISKSPYIEHMANFIAIVIPAGELLIVVALVIAKTRQLGLYASFALMFLFTAYIFMMLEFSYFVPCSCGGILQDMSWEQHLVFNIVFTLLSAYAALNNKLGTKSDKLHFATMK